VKLATTELEVLKVIGDEAKQNGAAALTARQIDWVVKASRTGKRRR
jgi:hypothetical protein